MKKLLRKLYCMMVLTITIGVVLGTTTVEALSIPMPNTFQGSQSIKFTKYIGNYQYFASFATDGTPLYCLESSKNPPRTTTFTKDTRLDNGLLYILQNGYPNKRFTGDDRQDHYITSAAIWWYMDRINGVSDSADGWLRGEFKTTASDPYNLRDKIRPLMESGLEHRNDVISHDIYINMDNDTMMISEDKKYFESALISVSSSAEFTDYETRITNATTGTKLVDENGNEKKRFAAGEKFRMLVPASEVKDLNEEFSVKVRASTAIPVAYRYDSGNDTLQDVTPGVDKEWTRVEKDIVFKLTTTKIKISKQDITTKKELAGAHLILRDSNNNIIDEWTSTTEAHYIDFLPAGKYTLEETIAPKGYVLNKQKVEFELTADGEIKEVVMYNEQIVEVPDTGVGSSIIIFMSGVGLLVLGIGTIYYYGKKQHI